MNINVQAMVQNIPTALVGWLGVFIVMAVIIAAVYALGALTNREGKKEQQSVSPDGFSVRGNCLIERGEREIRAGGSYAPQRVCRFSRLSGGRLVVYLKINIKKQNLDIDFL